MSAFDYDTLQTYRSSLGVKDTPRLVPANDQSNNDVNISGIEPAKASEIQEQINEVRRQYSIIQQYNKIMEQQQMAYYYQQQQQQQLLMNSQDYYPYARESSPYLSEPYQSSSYHADAPLEPIGENSDFPSQIPSSSETPTPYEHQLHHMAGTYEAQNAYASAYENQAQYDSQHAFDAQSTVIYASAQSVSSPAMSSSPAMESSARY